MIKSAYYTGHFLVFFRGFAAEAMPKRRSGGIIGAPQNCEAALGGILNAAARSFDIAPDECTLVPARIELFRRCARIE